MDGIYRFKRRFQVRAIKIVCGLVVSGCVCWTPALAADYSVIDLGGIPGRPCSEASSINSRGDVAGVVFPLAPRSRYPLYRAALLSRHAPIPLAGLGDRTSGAGGINDSDTVVGGVQDHAGAMHAFLWKGGKLTMLRGSGVSPSLADGINPQGQVVGEIQTAPGTSRAVEWIGAGSSPHYLDRPEWLQSSAIAINNLGDVVGYAVFRSDPGRSPHAVVWHGSQPTLLHGLATGLTIAHAINDSGSIVGQSDTGKFTIIPPDTAGNNSEFGMRESHRHAVLWSANRVTDLGVLPGYLSSSALGINRDGTIVGQFENFQLAPLRAFVWKNGKMYLLDSLIRPHSGWIFESAHAINDRGEICGVGTFHGIRRGFLLIPTSRPKSR